MKLKPEDLEKIQERMRASTSLREGAGRARVTVHLGTCGIAAGAREVLQAFLAALKDTGVKDVIVTTSGCAGLCRREPMATVEVEGLPLPIKAVSDLVVESKVQKGAVDIVDHKFVASFSKGGAAKSLFVVQAIFNYYTVRVMFDKPVRRFIVYECKKTKNADGSPQMRRYVIDYRAHKEDFKVFHRLINDATEEIWRRRVYLPNPSDMFEGDNSFDIYRLGLVDE